MVHVEPVRHLEEHAVAVLLARPPATASPRRRIRSASLELRRMRRLVVEPARDMPRRKRNSQASVPWRVARSAGPPPNSGASSAASFGRRAPRPRLLDPLDRAALHEQPLHRVERRQRVVPRLQRADLGGDAEQLADEILEMRRDIDQQVGFGFARRARPGRARAAISRSCKAASSAAARCATKARSSRISPSRS